MAADGYIRQLKNANCSFGVAREKVDGCYTELMSSGESDLLLDGKKSMSIMQAGWCCNRKKVYQYYYKSVLVVHIEL